MQGGASRSSLFKLFDFEVWLFKDFLILIIRNLVLIIRNFVLIIDRLLLIIDGFIFITDRSSDILIRHLGELLQQIKQPKPLRLCLHLLYLLHMRQRLPHRTPFLLTFSPIILHHLNIHLINLRIILLPNVDIFRRLGFLSLFLLIVKMKRNLEL